MQPLPIKIVTLIVLHIVSYSNINCSTISYDPADYLEVYPDPSDSEVLQGRKPLHFALIQSLGGPLSQFDGSGSVAGLKVALDRINNDTSLLPGYTLHYTFSDSKCNRTEGLKSFFSQINHEPTKLAIIGSGCSVATEPTAEISHFYNISQISCVSSSTELRNRVRFPYYYQLLSTEETLAYAFYGVIKEFGWRRVALIVQNENLFTVTVARLKYFLDIDNVEYREAIFDTAKGISDLGPDPFNMESRIFLFFMYSVNARPLICEAHRRQLRLPRYLFLTPGWYSQLWWREEEDGLSCTANDREDVLQSSLAFLHFVFLNKTADFNLTTTSGITGGEFLSKEKAFLGQAPLNLTFLEYSQYCYDATWTLAYALRETLASIDDPVTNDALARAYNVTPPFRLEDFTYNNNELLDIISGHINNTSFDGITGPVSFGDQGIRNLNKLIIFQFRNVTNATDGTKYLDWVEIGDVIETSKGNNYTFVYGPNENMETIFKGLVPYDGVAEKVILSVHISITVIFFFLSSMGIAFAIFSLVFNFKYRKSTLIRLASSQLNYLIGIGAIILYSNVYLSVIPTTNVISASVLCNLTPWLTAVGYSMCYGTILAKMARVYHIFNNPSPQKKGIHDWMLLLGVGAMVGIDILILIIYTAVEGARGTITAKLIPNRERPVDISGELGIITENCIYNCHSTSRDIFLGILYGYKMTLQIIALVLAFSIRKVKVKGLDDSKYIAAAIYVTSIVLAVIIVLTYSLKGYVNIFVTIFCTGFIAGTTVILLLVFVPLMVGIYKDPEGKNVFSKPSSTDPYNMKSTMTPSTTHNEDTDTSLRKRIKELESEVRTLKCEKQAVFDSHEEKPVGDSGGNPAVVTSLEMVTKETKFTGTIWDSSDVKIEIHE